MARLLAPLQMSKVESNIVQTPAAPTRSTIPHPKQRHGKPGGDVSESFDNREEGGLHLKIGWKWRYFNWNISWWKVMSVSDFENMRTWRGLKLLLFSTVSRIWQTGRWWWRRCDAALSRRALSPTKMGVQKLVHLDDCDTWCNICNFQDFWAHRLYEPLACMKFEQSTEGDQIEQQPNLVKVRHSRDVADEARGSCFLGLIVMVFLCALVSYFNLCAYWQYMDEILY